MGRGIDRATLKRLWPNAPNKLVEAVASQSPQVFARYRIDTPLRVAHFMAQISHESSGGYIAEESTNYTTPQRIVAVWPRRFTVETAQAYVRRPRDLANKVYNGRMGNRTGTDDGYAYRGRGLLQLTGRDAYRIAGERLGLDLVREPRLAIDTCHALEIAAFEFTYLKCIEPADRDDVVGVTRRVNGGTTNLADRKRWLAKWKQALPELPGDPSEIEENEIDPRGNDAPPPAEIKSLGWSKTIISAVTNYFGGLGATIMGFFDKLHDPFYLAAFCLIILFLTFVTIMIIKGRIDVQKIVKAFAQGEEL